MDVELKKAVVREVKDLIINDQGIQVCIANIRAQNSDTYRVVTDILQNNTKAHDMIGIYSKICLQTSSDWDDE